MVEEVLFEHPAPLLYVIHQTVLKGFDVQLQPAAKHPLIVHLAHSCVQRLKLIDLGGHMTVTKKVII